ncbi:unnamed protein product [Fusarium equiseti]|uniref:NmrA-like domain-containing protein n=1 Tax=Fusarium equiseti TaxID=61235 RepID=A0A8J2ISH1_FUSEQ|nr:unnamed protein product [Fusarium equiseti]
MVFKAAQGCKAVFLHTFSFPGLEATRAKTVIEACEKVGVMSIVASTSIFTAKQHFWHTDSIKSTVLELHQYQLSKYEVEGIVRGSGLQSYTIFLPVMLHFDFYLPPVFEKLPRLPTCGELDDPLTDGTKLPFIDVNDLGKYVGAALLDRARFGGAGGLSSK